MKRLAMTKYSIAAMALIVLVLACGQPAWAQDEVKSCARNNPPTIDGIISPGEYMQPCTYNLDLNGAYDEDGNLVDPPLEKQMTLSAINDRVNVYLAYQWTHLWNQDLSDENSSPDRYLLLSAFDFDGDGLFEDNDALVYTIDDGLGLLYLGFDIGDPNPPQDAWIKIYIPTGLYVISWSAALPGAEAIGGPASIPGTIWNGVQPAGNPGPLDRDGVSVAFPYAVSRSPGGVVSGQVYTYTFEFAVPKRLFYSTATQNGLEFEPAGFGIFLSQETNSMSMWTWPTDISDWKLGEVTAESAESLGVLKDLLPGSTGVLALGPDLPVSPVGGVMTPVNKADVLSMWAVACTLVGVVAATVALGRRRT